MSSKKILVINTFRYMGGDIKMYLLGLPYLSEADWNLYIATSARGEVYENLLQIQNSNFLLLETGGSELSELESSPINKVRLRITSLKAIYTLAKVVRKEKIDLIYSIDRGMCTKIAYAVSKLTGCPLLLSAHTTYYLHLGTNNFHHKVINHATYISVLTEAMRNEFHPYVTDPDKLFILENACDLTQYSKSHNGEGIRKELGISPHTQVIVLAGRLNPWKGQIELIQAIPLIVKEKSDTYFIIAGAENQPGFENKLIALIKQLKLETYVNLVGFRSDLPDVFSCADIVTLPSHGEGFGLVVLEAMAMGKPVVATRVGGIPSFIFDGETGILIPPKDHVSLANALLMLLNDPNLAQTIGHSAKESVLNKYDKDSYGSRFVSFINQGFEMFKI